MTTVTPDPRPEARKVASAHEWRVVAAEKSGPCRGCGKPYNYGHSFHHLVPKSLRGDDLPANIIPLCGSGTTGCHGAIENHTPGWEEVAHALRESLTPLELAYVKAKKGRVWLDRAYPAGDAGLCPRCRKRVKADAEPAFDKTPRPRKQVTITVPVDERENGAEILRVLFEEARKEAGRPEGTPVYFTLVDVLHFFLTTPKAAK